MYVHIDTVYILYNIRLLNEIDFFRRIICIYVLKSEITVELLYNVSVGGNHYFTL